MSNRKKDALKLIVRFALGALFLAAGGLKISQADAFAATISNYQILPERLTFFAGLWLPWLEIAVGLTLMLGYLTSGGAILATLMSGAFAYAIGSAVASGRTVDCGCFAGDSTATWSHVLLNLGMCLVGIVIVQVGPGRFSLQSRSKHFGEENASSVPKHFAAGIILLTLCNLGLILSQDAPASQAPGFIQESGISFSESEIAFGRVKQGQKLKKEIQYTNSSQREIQIEDVRSTCGCTTSDPSKRSLRPGESGQLVVTFDAGTKSGPSETTVALHLKNTAEPAILRVRADIVPLILVSPEVVDLEPGKPQRVVLTGQDGFRFQVKDVRTTTPGLSARFVEQTSSNVVTIEVSQTTELAAPPEPQTVWPVHIYTDVVELPPFSIYARGQWK